MSYLMAGQLSEIERLRLQSRVWEPAGERLRTSLPTPLYSQAERTDRNQKELGSSSPPSSSHPMCQHEHVSLT